MTATLSAKEIQMIAQAHDLLVAAMHKVFDGREPVPAFMPADFSELTRDQQDGLLQAEERSYRLRPELSAIHFCLSSSVQLLAVCQQVAKEDPSQTLVQHIHWWQRLVEDTKIAGRGAYRAALILSEAGCQD